MKVKKFEVDKLIETHGNGSNISKICALLDDIEKAIAAEVPIREIVRHLNEQGIMEISVKSFTMTLDQAKQRRHEAEQKKGDDVQKRVAPTKNNAQAIIEDEPIFNWRKIKQEDVPF